MPEEQKQEEIRKEELIDVGDSDEKATEIDLEKKAEGGEVKDEKTTQDSDKPADTPEKLDEPVDVRDSKNDKEQTTKEEVKEPVQEQKKELEEYSEGVKKRIAKLTRKMREAERQKEEAVTYAKRVMRERDELTHTATTLDRDYAHEMENRIKSSLAAAQAKLAASREADDKKAEVEALTAISQLGYEQGKLAEIKSRQKTEETAQENRRKQGPAAQYPSQPTPPADPKAEDWAEKNEWFGKDNAMTYTAFDLHRKLTEEEGYDPKSDSYYQEIDKRIRLEFPHKFGKSVERTINKPVQNVASATRSTRVNRKSVKLTPSQVAIAKKLRVPLEEYARQLKLTEGE
jgi:DNA repair exonuclease SbcCD ATPase subunit